MNKNKKILELVMTALILVCAFYAGRLGAGITASGGVRSETGSDAASGVVKQELGTVVYDKITVVVDAGHGGIDSGKVGVNGALEKEVNLSIAKKLAARLEENGITAVLTREEDSGLYDEGEANKKQQDMKRRCAAIDELEPFLAVSIHQNSYTESSVKGPQVFFYESSAQGKELAAALQEALNEMLEIERPREIKANDSYYLLRKTKSPTVIVECGFLSNPEEAEKLVTDAYQETVAEAVCSGILNYIGTHKEDA
nr:N-acetylmuramoyl-L-alanine amidase [uncultured Marvinbryantia sp.]